MASSFSADEIHILKLIIHVSSAFSMIGSLFIIVSFLAFPLERKAHSQLIFWLSVCDFGASASYFALPIEKSNGYCIAQGASIQYFQISSFCWTACIAISLYFILVNKKQDISSYYKWYHLFSWSAAALDIGIGFALHAYGDANFTEGKQHSWCWIKAENNSDKFGLYFGPFFVIWIFDLIMYILVSRQILRIIRNSKIRGRATHRIRLYLLVFMLCIGVGVINRVQYVITNEPLFWLSIIDAFISPLQGFLNSIVYGMNKKLREKWFKTIFCCFFRKKQENNEKRPLLHVNREIQIE